jgi:hypothetical protein
MLAWNAIAREVGAVTPDRQDSASEIQLYIVSLRPAHFGAQLGFRSPLNTDLVAPIIFFAPMPDVAGELRCQSSRKIQGHGSSLIAFYRIEAVEHTRDQTGGKEVLFHRQVEISWRRLNPNCVLHL